MATVPRKAIVVDVSLMRSAGYGTAESRICRACLESIRDVCHRIVVTDELKKERRRKLCRPCFGLEWYMEMIGRGESKVVSVNLAEDRTFRDLKEVARNHKDTHLVAAALKQDAIVLSLDNRAANAFADLLDKFPLLEKLMWCNPARSHLIQEWLDRGAPQESRYLLQERSWRENADGC